MELPAPNREAIRNRDTVLNAPDPGDRAIQRHTLVLMMDPTKYTKLLPTKRLVYFSSRDATNEARNDTSGTVARCSTLALFSAGVTSGW